MSDSKNYEDSPFHPGEHMVQERLGVRDIEDWARKVVRPYLPDDHRAFHTAQPFLVIAARDKQERPWVTLLAGSEDFISSPDPQSLVIDAKPARGDALELALVDGADIGILGIELATRRRNRVNGRIRRGEAGALVCSVDQSFGNCPQYIREREWRRVEGEPAGTPTRGTHLTSSQQEWIASADTFFIASGHRGEGESPTYGMDASHRGGDAGLVQIENESRVVFPDYAGNNHFNTIGNLVLNPHVGLLFVDFETGSLLQVTGRAAIDWDSENVALFPGARRLVAIDIEEIVELPAALSLRWDASAESVRSLRLIEKIPESDDVTSFVFEARDGGELPDFQSGQHLPIELEVEGFEENVRRTYSLSCGPSQERYRISVKREPLGIASRHLHDNVEVGAILDTRTPAGDFVLPCENCPVVLVSAGIGVTPMVSMLHALVDERNERDVWFIHGARDGNHHPLAREIHEVAARRPGVQVHVAYSKPRSVDAFGKDYDSKGRVDGALLINLVGSPDAHYLLCGPTLFMAEVQTDLEQYGVSADRIHTESFGPAG
ncbi:MAG: pyridoxamine 5'-phosphate oxidase family protein [Gammaproteobacteria bacterium]|nr:pyridoxamine 5'-phosphate oxidase family protein [Gammaproteobacteria bacterium]